MIHLHRWRPIGVRLLYRHIVFDRSNGCPVTQVVRKCSRCGRVKDGEIVNGHWDYEQLFGEPVATRAEQSTARTAVKR